MNSGAVGFSEIIGLITAFLLTLAIFSYVIGDNMVFRIASSIFVGASAGMVVSGIAANVLWPRLFKPLMDAPVDQKLVLLIPLILGALTFGFLWPKTHAPGAIPLAFLAGIGAATIIGGAVLGTIFPLIGSTLDGFDPKSQVGFGWSTAWSWTNNLLVLIGLITALWSFQFTNLLSLNPVQKLRMGFLQTLGRCFIAIALAVIFFGVLIASQAAVVERAQFLKEFVHFLITPGG